MHRDVKFAVQTYQEGKLPYLATQKTKHIQFFHKKTKKLYLKKVKITF